MKRQPILSIAIPTYNRVDYLNRCLSSIFSQLEEVNDDVEIIVSDNASTDGTKILLDSLATEGKPFTYHCNEENLGGDKNISLCYEYASGVFAWVFSDDDFLVQGSLKKIVDLLKKYPNVGNCYISNRWYKKDSERIISLDSRLAYVVTTPAEQFEKVHYWITFISGNIVNKKLIEQKPVKTLPIGTNLVQLGWIVPSIFISEKNIFIKNELVCCKIQENRGYPIVKIFCTNLLHLLRQFEREGRGPNLVKIVRTQLMKNFFLPQIAVMLLQKENVLLPMFKEYFSSVPFWLKFLPRYAIQKFKNARV